MQTPFAEHDPGQEKNILAAQERLVHPAVPLAPWFPDALVQLYFAYRKLDKLVCLLKKKKVYVSRSALKAFSDLFDHDSFEVLLLICPPVISVVHREGLELPEIVLQPGGLSESRITARSLAIIDSFARYAREQFFRSYTIIADESPQLREIRQEKEWGEVVKSGFPADFKLKMPNQDSVVLSETTKISSASALTTIYDAFACRKTIIQARGLEDLASQTLAPDILQLLNVEDAILDPDCGASRLLGFMKLLPSYKDQVKFTKTFEARAPSYLKIQPPELPGILQHAVLHHLGINLTDGLFKHQALGLNALRRGDHLSIATETSSGKSLIYNICVAESILQSRYDTALYLFPTKALAQDQLRALRRLCGHHTNDSDATLPISASILDGDSSEDHRDNVAKGPALGGPQIVLSNPDMLHYTLLPNHFKYQAFFKGLRYIVIDEAHHYKGAFGAHVSCVIRRLLRICFAYNREPQIVLCSATIPCPRALFEQFLPFCNSDRLSVVNADQSGSTKGKRVFSLWNPPKRALSEESTGKEQTVGAATLHEPIVTDYQQIHREEVKPLCSPRRLEGEDFDHLAEYKDDRDMQEFLRSCEDRSRFPVTWRGLHGDKPRRKPQDISFKSADQYERIDKVPSQPLSFERKRMEPHLRESSIIEISRLLAFCIYFRLRTLCFCGTRQLVERVNCLVQNELKKTYSAEHLLPCVASYRGGYSIEERRRIEMGLADGGGLLAVIATCALELGVDVGSLDVTLHLGFPGSHASLWQQAGRAGRGGRLSLSIMVCWQSSPVDQFFTRNPEKLFSTPPEHIVIGAFNPYILKAHVLCAAHEIPLEHVKVKVFDGEKLWGCSYDELVFDLQDAGHLKALQFESGRRFTSAVKGDTLIYDHPAASVNLRVIDPVNIRVCDASRGMVVIDTMPYSRAFYEAFEGAIFFQQAKQYQITELNLNSCQATCRPVRVDYFTSSESDAKVTIQKQIFGHGELIGFGTITVVKTSNGFLKHSISTHRVLEEGTCHLPPLKMETCAVWINIPLIVRRNVESCGFDIWASLHAANHMFMTVASISSFCDTGDLDCEHFADHRGLCRLLLYDRTPGGIGISERIAKLGTISLLTAVDLVNTCNCYAGCPDCVFSSHCSEYNENLSKSGAKYLFQELLRFHTHSDPNMPEGRANTPSGETDDTFSGGSCRTDAELSPRKRRRAMLMRQSEYRDAQRSRGLFVDP